MTNTEIANASKIIYDSQEILAMYIGNNLIWEQQSEEEILPYDAEIQYLKNNGNSAYIDCNLNITHSLLNNADYIEYITDAKFLSNGAEGKNRLYCFLGVSNENYYSGLGGLWQSSNISNDQQRHIFKLIKSQGIVYLYVDDTIIDSYLYTQNDNDQVTDQSFNLFQCTDFNNPSFVQEKYYAKLTIDNNILFEMIPVRVGQNGYMYDKISKRLFGSKTNNNFVLGPDKMSYVSDGLIFHLDGIDKGTGAEWTDLIGGIQFNRSKTDIYSTQDGYYFDGDRTSYLSSEEGVWTTGSDDFTVEVCYYNLKNSLTNYIFHCGANSTNNKFPLFYHDGSTITWYQGGYVYNASSMTSNTKYTISLNNDRAIANGSLLQKSNNTDYWDANNTRIRIGAASSGNAFNNPFNGYIYSIRVYNRRLTEAEQLQNQRVDNQRFNLGLSL